MAMSRISGTPRVEKSFLIASAKVFMLTNRNPSNPLWMVYVTIGAEYPSLWSIHIPCAGRPTSRKLRRQLPRLNHVIEYSPGFKTIAYFLEKIALCATLRMHGLKEFQKNE
jgi:hypothetical protein